MEKDTANFLQVKDAKKIDTKDAIGNPNGFLLELVSDRDGFTKHITGQMYMSVGEPGAIKGYHLHALADYYVIVIKGTVKYTAYRDQHTKQEVELGSDQFKLIHLPKGHPHALEVLGNEPAYALMYRYPAWDESAHHTDRDEQLDIDPRDIEKDKTWRLIDEFKKKLGCNEF